MIHKAQALALRVDPFSRTSQIVSWLTPSEGRLPTLAKGAQRPRSGFRGQIDVFYTCEIIYYSAGRSGLSTLKECTVLEAREPLRHSIRASACASYLCDLVHRLTPQGTGAHQEPLYRFLEQYLDALCDRNAVVPGRIAHWAEIRLLGLLGMAPRLGSCTACGLAATPANPFNVISVSQGGLVCARCQPTVSGPFMPLGPDVLAILKSWQASEAPLCAKRTACSPDQLANLSALLGALLAYHLELPPSRAIAFDLLSA